ncbi:MAG: transcription elongation factor GreA [Candidatus Sungbacteria bacterium RIFCSPLOWO2_12_FULL_41_11]|uniref:Transcription elongation factor GreA n=1 Tax=Candidatus Sungbacteria bacterium RIFCSPLOWO2_12_FULL_41_11 TaxID=1802286 RepID=A0A1G2LT57_9BACT|nr:MAG: Transcription elongation factor GreA [Parcubacteria group bacterium GW2011_GWA2_42_14]OGZ99311.1 MAG: transcription elongation factor GreA [Candidatus Sungbacteria bacterium RIFCSPHIGHO2_02_FULL_41_12b]OHA14838.1 MAG: transcription elongation factor GreA [Candidatus Sungbacteria bacterium RIFCSPLOWO2_12_FULL_41_11]
MADYISPEGLEKLKEELNKFKTEERQAIAARLESAKALGDLSENAEYQEAKEAQSLNEARIVELEEMLKDIIVIKKPVGTDFVQIGSQVVTERDGNEEIYTIVGSEEADPVSGKISNESPMGKSFLGKRRGETVEVKTPGGNMTYMIKDIR